jgi:metal-sulfur cluster biosynthetic enzyme
MATPTSSEILDALRGVVDPEMGINIVDLGLVYETAARDGDVRVVMTMTTAACPLGESMADEAAAVIRRRVRGVKSVSVQLVWEPAWQPSMMSDAARAQLGWK